MRLLLDMDDVTVLMSPTWLRIYNEEWNDKVHVDDLTSWNTTEFVKPECGQAIYEIYHRDGFFLDLPEVPGAVEAINRLRDKGHEIVFVSHAPDQSATAHRDKYRWLAARFPWFTTENLILTKRKDLVRGDVLFDDGPIYLESFQKHQHFDEPDQITVAMDRPYNKDVVANCRVHMPDAWAQFEAFVDLEAKRRGENGTEDDSIPGQDYTCLARSDHGTLPAREPGGS